MAIRLLTAGAAAALFVGFVSGETICPPQIRWQRAFGSGGSDVGQRILQTDDGGYVIGGWSSDFSGGAFAGADFYLLRLDWEGQKVWDRSYGGNYSDQLYSLEQTADNGFILAGTSYSSASGDKTSPGYGYSDFWIVRTDASGNKLWEKSFGGTVGDNLVAGKVISDGGFILGGYSQSPPSGNKSATNFGADDFWVLRLDAEGNKIWERSFGGSASDYLLAVQQTADGGFLLGGSSSSEPGGNKTAPAHGQYDFWLVRLDALGNKLWDRSYGGDSFDEMRGLLIAPNGDILLAGSSFSDVSGNRTAPGFGSGDFWVLRVDPDGNILWQAAYGGTSYEQLFNAAPAPGETFLLCGASYSGPGGSKTSRAFSGDDYWVVKIDANGNQIWDASFGGMRSDRAWDTIRTADGGYIVVGESDFVGGNKTAPHFGNSDIWVIKLNPENAADCDNDQVPNAQDLCPESAFGALVNANGCSIDQFCPCDGWLAHADYVACVERVSADFESAGLITTAKRAELLAAAHAAECPRSFVRFGMVHLPMKDTLVTGGDEAVDFLPGIPAVYGASVLLGEADSGIFIDPDSSGWGYAHPDWFLEGKVYGRFGNGSNGLVARVRATKPDIEVYPIEIDFTPLGPTNLTIQYFSDDKLLSADSTAGAVGSLTIGTAAYLGPRVNPFWRMPDQSIGVLIEFTQGRLGGEDDSYNRIFIRADGITQPVDYISRVEVGGGGGLERFSFLDERLGMFGNRHRILGNGLFHAADRQLTVNQRDGTYAGTTIEFGRRQHFEADLLPIELMTNGASVQIDAQSDVLVGSVQIFYGPERPLVRAEFPAAWSPEGSNTVPAAAAVEVKAFRNGIIAGSCIAPNASFIGHLVVTGEPPPRIIGCVASASSNAPPTIAFSLDQLAVFVCTNGNELRGTHFSIAPIDPPSTNDYLANLHLVVWNQDSFTITGERSASAQPRLAIASSDNDIMLSWADNTRLFRLESSPSLPTGFTTVPGDPEFINNQNRVVLPRESTGSRFFRLRSGPD
jgi:hypothetical protein